LSKQHVRVLSILPDTEIMWQPSDRWCGFESKNVVSGIGI
jgi:hypothetical protein